MKYTILLLSLMPTLLFGSLSISNLKSTYINSTVVYENSVYHYKYKAATEINDKDISNITINLNTCQDIYDLYGDDSFKVEYVGNDVKFDNIKPKGNSFVFGFFSKFAPELGESNIKAATKTYTGSVLVPSCNIPEPSVLSLMFGFLFLAKRKCRY